MSPRAYRMGKRAESATSTRDRIIEATAELHLEKGILETTYADIAGRADVGLGTVYHHFPQVDDLYGACGTLVMQRARIPQPELLEGTSGSERIERMVTELFAHYRRYTTYERARAASLHVPLIAERLARRDKALTAFVQAALPEGAGRTTVDTVQAMTTYDAWKHLTTAGRLSTKRAAVVMSDAIAAVVAAAMVSN